MSRDTSPQARIALAEKLWQLARTRPSDLAEEILTNGLAVEVLRSGLHLYIEHVQSQAGLRDEDECVVSLPLYEWELLVLFHHIPPHSLTLGASARKNEQAFTQSRGQWKVILVLLKRLCNSIDEVLYDETRPSQWLPDSETCRAFMKRSSDFNGTPETEDHEYGKTYQCKTVRSLIRSLARRIESQLIGEPQMTE
jgi:hypothetical protein